ncbi:hypothetical protein [Streptomyces lancefieldiae]|uniref:Uncharacterized protein n=1 Tax=Streptomyces lancefieldiae TaxID=3075520 RepID=A0ABU3B457_9ACTN|nr:hypothetical protein [Streptomyces sp. DSM 40712]MDT0616093.1 hypothetical protein [Streptomyces sp. DSM 40712]
MTTGRYHLALTTGGRPLLHGWWYSETTARRKFAAWIGRHGARITLTDEESGTLLTQWPQTQ